MRNKIKTTNFYIHQNTMFSPVILVPCACFFLLFFFCYFKKAFFWKILFKCNFLLYFYIISIKILFHNHFHHKCRKTNVLRKNTTKQSRTRKNQIKYNKIINNTKNKESLHSVLFGNCINVLKWIARWLSYVYTFYFCYFFAVAVAVVFQSIWKIGETFIKLEFLRSRLQQQQT